MFSFRRAMMGAFLVAALLGGALFFSDGGVKKVEAANGCGPSLLQLYVIIPDQISYWHLWYGWETFDFEGACNAHDDCYSGSGIPRSTCDTNFLNDMLDVCEDGWTWGSRTYCSSAAYTYYGAVAAFGWVAYTP